MPDKIDMNAFAFRNTLVERFYNRANEMNAKKPDVNEAKRGKTFEGPMGTGFTKDKKDKPEITA